MLKSPNDLNPEFGVGFEMFRGSKYVEMLAGKF